MTRQQIVAVIVILAAVAFAFTPPGRWMFANGYSVFTPAGPHQFR